MKATRIILAAMVLGTAIGASQANAQSCASSAGSCTTTNTASVTVGTMVKLDLGSATTALTAPTPAQIEAGATIANAGPTFAIKANKGWTLKIKSLNPTNWTYTGSDAGVKSISDLLWSNALAGTYAPITASDVTFSSGAKTSGTNQAIYFETVWAAGMALASNAPGQYDLPIQFTLSAP
ncbi:MAG TPA: hypothetical protein VM166_09745 [Gemmatimonadaceae bacterium]|nr:hypothetical protein [Gemmatimonadaceae bacterium]